MLILLRRPVPCQQGESAEYSFAKHDLTTLQMNVAIHMFCVPTILWYALMSTTLRSWLQGIGTAPLRLSSMRSSLTLSLLSLCISAIFCRQTSISHLLSLLLRYASLPISLRWILLLVYVPSYPIYETLNYKQSMITPILITLAHIGRVAQTVRLLQDLCYQEVLSWSTDTGRTKDCKLYLPASLDRPVCWTWRL